MILFQFDADAARTAWSRQGWVHLKDAVTPAFLARATALIHQTVQSGPDAVGGNAANKEQFRFDFDEPVDAQAQIFAAFGPVAGRDAAALTLSERHVNAYRDSAVTHPVPHKDRRASQITVGLAIDVPPGSHLVLYPAVQRAENPYDSAAELYERLPLGERPDRALVGAPEVLVHDRPGDIVIFGGSTTWHCRRFAAGTTNLFFKLNDFGDDPLGEDVRHGTDARTQALAASTQP